MQELAVGKQQDSVCTGCAYILPIPCKSTGFAEAPCSVTVQRELLHIHVHVHCTCMSNPTLHLVNATYCKPDEVLA